MVRERKARIVDKSGLRFRYSIEKKRNFAYNKITMKQIENIDDKFFKKIIKNPLHARNFLEKVLPKNIKKHLDFSKIHIESTDSVSGEFNEGFTDITVKVKMKTKKGKKIPTDIYFIIEHKTEGKKKILLQLLKYMYFAWEEDMLNRKSLRIIIPVVFYHGRKKWKVPKAFVDQFDVDSDVKRFLLNYRYVFFDTDEWNLADKNNKGLRENVFLFSALALMKAAFKNDLETLREIIKFWHEKGFNQDKDNLLYFLVYISHTQEISLARLDKMLEESKIPGGEIMQTLAQHLREEGIKIGIEKGERIGIEKGERIGVEKGERIGVEKGERIGVEKGERIGVEKGERIGVERGERNKAVETAKKMLSKGFDINIIMELTGLGKEEIKKLS